MRTIEERLNIVRKIARNLLRKYHLQPPVDVFSLAEKEGLLVRYEENQVGVDGMAALNTAHPTITLNPEITYLPRRRFTLAHEIGHVKIGWHTGITGCSTDNPFVYVQQKRLVDSQELEANTFASELLMPTDWLKEKMEAASDLRTLIERITKEANASVMACLYALQQALPSGHAIFITTDAMEYWKAFLSPDTYTWSVGGFNKFHFLEQTALRRKSFQIGSYSVQHFEMSPCPDAGRVKQLFAQCGGDLGKTLEELSSYFPDSILHCLNVILEMLPDEFFIIIEDFEGGLLSCKTPHCNMRAPYSDKSYDELKSFIEESGENWGELPLIGQRHLLWIRQNRYEESHGGYQDSKSMLQELIKEYFGDEDGKRVIWHINGVIGNANTRNDLPREKLFQFLKARFSLDEEIGNLRFDQRFDQFLSNRISEILMRRK